MLSPRLIGDFLRGGRLHRYGEHPSQCAELRMPRGGGPHPVIVLVHGGSWSQRYGKFVTRALAGDLVRRGWAAWNIEYRRLGEGGGWPETFLDVAAAIDLLASLDGPLDLERTTVVGHSSGGHLALWAAGRERLPAGAPGAFPAVRPRRAVGLAAVADLAGAHARWRGGIVNALMGGSPEERPERYALADPIAQVPLALPVLLVHGVDDATVSIELARSYARRAAAAGAPVELVEVEGEAGAHRAHVDPRGAAWARVVKWLSTPAAAPGGPAGAAGAAGAARIAGAEANGALDAQGASEATGASEAQGASGAPGGRDVVPRQR